MPDFLSQHADGDITLTGHRIGIYHIIHYYQEGFSPEMLACQYPTLPLSLIHKIIAYYLDNRTEVDDYVSVYRRKLDEQRKASPRQIDTVALRARLEASQRAEAS